MKKIVALVGILSVFVLGLFGQEAIKSLEEEYFDYLALTGIAERPYLTYRTLSDSVWELNTDEDLNFNNPWQINNLGKKYDFFEFESSSSNFFLNGINKKVSAKFYGPELYNSYNTVNPYGQNDGGMWQGAGYNAALTGGARLEAFGLELTFKPQLSFSQNKAFDYTAGVYGKEESYFTWVGGGIDLVQRYGDKAFFNYDWGDTEARYSFYTFTVGYGSSNPWIGPAYLNPMLGSNNAGGYPKFDIGFRKTSLYLPWNNCYLGDFEARAINGKLTESKYFDYNDSNDSRMLNGLFVSYAPSFIPGLTLGANRIILTGWSKNNLKYFARLFTFSNDNDVDGPGEDQKISITFDYLFPTIGFEVYGEYGMDDFTSDLPANPFHTGIYTIGLKQDIPLWASATAKNIRSELIIECNDFEMSQDFQLQWGYGGYYTHGKIMQGYTQNGQILGAGSGYFGNSQYLKYTVYYPKGKTSLIVHRSCPNNNFIYNQAVSQVATYGTDVYWKYYASNITFFDFGLETTYFVLPSLIVNGKIIYDYIHNWKFERGNDIQDNFHFELGLQYNF